ncbi:contactin-1a-like [Hypomesus transpacificus]|uniref:contactin-1a-like n=1 Tax=Hypomesus transpacificus TaxID=137520 RepID=UPI001F07FB19|nr:contactin-1a-like [Hypomesus transpacificus]XP_046889541.1 contactin-1a-like [Hypomesus transpacificus]XP_046889542.1 contactin-1a-like [Hypomesus transpacificus]
MQNIPVHLLVLGLALALSSTAASLCGEGPGFYGGQGPVFEEQPVDTIYPEESPEAKITMSCRARANPPATYKWRLDSTDIDLAEDSHYVLVGGNLVISNPIKSKHIGKYSCMASNQYGSIISREALVQFGYLDFFSSEEREAVYVKEGQGAVLLCAPPPHYPAELSFRWMLNEFPIFIPLDKRRFVSQSTGNLYISKVESSDSGNYSCFVSSPSIAKSVFSKFIPLVPLAERSTRKYPADIKVKFPDTYALVGQNITLECFALGNPIPLIHWSRMEGELPLDAKMSMAGAHLHLYNVQYEDEGTYECQAVNSKGKDWHRARVSVEAFPEWVESINSTEQEIRGDYTMSCLASGKPKPHVRWLKNGDPYDKHELKFNGLMFDDSGMYQCIAENRHGIIYANAEMRVITCAPTFEHSPVRGTLAAKNGRVVMECRPKAAPKPDFSWSKGTELLSNNTRIFLWEDGSLEILKATRSDEGRYTCFAENDQGKANSTGSLTITDATKITLAPSNADVKVGESTSMQCAASHDTLLDITFIWSLDGLVIDMDRESEHYEHNPNGSSSGELQIKNSQLKHAGRYTCTAQTPVDNVTASADLVVRGPPGSPGGVRVSDIKDKSVRVTWSRGTDNHSPISKYTIQYRDSLFQDWRAATTSPADVEGNSEEATVVDLFPWTEYEFRVIATNTLGIGDPSPHSPKVTTKDAVPVVAPSDIGGGGKNSRELIITWTPVQPQYYYGSNFGYLIAFKPFNEKVWRKVTVAEPEAKEYVHRDSFIPPSTEIEVKVKAFNSKGEGPYSLTAVIYSAQDAPSEAPTRVEGRALSATDAIVWWLPISQQGVEGYQVKYWRKKEDSETAEKVQVTSRENQTRLEDLKPDSHYFIEVLAFNAAGFGPPSKRCQIHTKKAPPSRPPKILSKKLKGSSVNIAWEHVEPLANESTIYGYKVLYRQAGLSTGTLYTTLKKFIDLPLYKDGDYVVEVRAHTEGGDGAVAQVRIAGGGAVAVQGLSLASLLLVALICLGL